MRGLLLEFGLEPVSVSLPPGVIDLAHYYLDDDDAVLLDSGLPFPEPFSRRTGELPGAAEPVGQTADDSFNDLRFDRDSATGVLRQEHLDDLHGLSQLRPLHSQSTDQSRNGMVKVAKASKDARLGLHPEAHLNAQVRQYLPAER